MVTSSTAGPSTAAAGGLREVMRRHPLFFYFLMACAFSWIVLIPFILSEWGMLSVDSAVGTLAFALNPFAGPTLAAIIVTGVTEGRAGVRRLLRRCVQGRAGWQWYLFILLGIPALFVLGIAVLPGAMASFQGFPPQFVGFYLVNFVIIFFLGGPLGEEIGWRGFALPRVQLSYGPLWGTLLLGIVWVFWHLPHFLTSAQRGGPGMTFATFLTNLAVFLPMVVSMAIIFTWVFNHTRGSLFIAVLLHASINTFGVAVTLFAAPIVTDTDLAILIGAGVPALLILILTRGRLGYQPSEAPQLKPLATEA
ncbi:MAG: CPBP family intramembrane glutamic endopeptidase [Chloroflexota bacterium]